MFWKFMKKKELNGVFKVSMAHRKEKINDLIRDEVGKIIHQNLDLDMEALPTVLRALVSDDLNHVRIFISVFPSSFGEEVLAKINQQIYFLQQILNKKLKIHPVPKMYFVLDQTEAKAAEVEKIIEKVKDK